MSQQNKIFMKKSGTTDVLSFPSQSVKNSQIGSRKIFQGSHLGDILISLDQAKRQALEQRVSVRKEVVYLIVHSILHLIGYDHATRQQQNKMHGLESLIWTNLIRKKTL